MNTQLSFRNTQFDIANHSGQIWLRGTEIAKALGMEKIRCSKPDIQSKFRRIYRSHDLDPQIECKGVW